MSNEVKARWEHYVFLTGLRVLVEAVEPQKHRALSSIPHPERCGWLQRFETEGSRYSVQAVGLQGQDTVLAKIANGLAMKRFLVNDDTPDQSLLTNLRKGSIP